MIIFPLMNIPKSFEADLEPILPHFMLTIAENETIFSKSLSAYNNYFLTQKFIFIIDNNNSNILDFIESNANKLGIINYDIIINQASNLHLSIVHALKKLNYHNTDELLIIANIYSFIDNLTFNNLNIKKFDGFYQISQPKEDNQQQTSINFNEKILFYYIKSIKLLYKNIKRFFFNKIKIKKYLTFEEIFINNNSIFHINTYTQYCDYLIKTGIVNNHEVLEHIINQFKDCKNFKNLLNERKIEYIKNVQAQIDDNNKKFAVNHKNKKKKDRELLKDNQEHLELYDSLRKTAEPNKKLSIAEELLQINNQLLFPYIIGINILISQSRLDEAWSYLLKATEFYNINDEYELLKQYLQYFEKKIRLGRNSQSDYYTLKSLAYILINNGEYTKDIEFGYSKLLFLTQQFVNKNELLDIMQTILFGNPKMNLNIIHPIATRIMSDEYNFDYQSIYTLLLSSIDYFYLPNGMLSFINIAQSLDKKINYYYLLQDAFNIFSCISNIQDKKILIQNIIHIINRIRFLYSNDGENYIEQLLGNNELYIEIKEKLLSQFHNPKLYYKKSNLNIDQPLKIALCFRGQLRGYKQAWEQTLEINKEFFQKHHIDIFIHTWDKLGFKDLYRCCNYEYVFPPKTEQLFHLYFPKYKILSLEDYFPSLNRQLQDITNNVNENDLLNVYGANLKNLKIENVEQSIPSNLIKYYESLGYINHIKQQIFQYYSVLQSHILYEEYLKTSKNNYDIIISARPDYTLNFNKIYNQQVFKSINEGYLIADMNAGLYHDQSWMGTHQVMKLASNMYNYLDKFANLESFEYWPPRNIKVHMNTECFYMLGITKLIVKSKIIKTMVSPKIPAQSIMEMIQIDLSKKQTLSKLENDIIKALEQDIEDGY